MEITYSNFHSQFKKIDPRYIVTFLLLVYNVLGFTILGFNRTPFQILSTVVFAVLLHLFYDYIFFKKIYFSISAVTTALGLGLLVNYGHNAIYPLIPIFIAISSKFLFTFNGKHRFNPGMFGVAISVLFASSFISAAPAYQWNGISSMALFIIMPAIIFFMPTINRHYLVLSFLAVFVLQITLRSILITHYLPFQTLFFGTISSPAFFLFTFFMITDPATSPADKKSQVIIGVSLGIVDLLYHLVSSYHTFFYAALTVGSIRFLWAHLQSIRTEGLKEYFKEHFIKSKYYFRFFTIVFITIISITTFQFINFDQFLNSEIGFNLKKINSEQSNLHFTKGELLDSVDDRVKHMGKWFLAITDGIAVGDFDNDGLVDIFMTNAHKSKNDRNALFKNMGEFKFKRIPSETLTSAASDFSNYGINSNAMLVDFDNDGDLDIFITYAFGKNGSSRLFKNLLSEKRQLSFKDITQDSNLFQYSNSATANFFDMNNDGFLDVVVGNTIATHLPDYQTETKLDFFKLPEKKDKNDRRMFNFMHDSWHQANNGGLNYIFTQNADHTFKKLDPLKIHMPETKWTMAIGTADLNQDGYTDLYMANDFGPDDLYYNNKGLDFIHYKEKMFGSIGNDTYKGMNATIADFDNNHYLDIHVSNVHHPLQAEGNLLWYFYPNHNDSFYPEVKDQATYTAMLNEHRFGWGANVTDFNHDGWIDLVQANGMVDNIYDKRPEQSNDDCPDFWYINEKIARSPPNIHRYIDNWGDIRGNCIHPFEKNRLYLNRGTHKKPQFIDVADKINLNEALNFRGAAVADFNNDGSPDLLISSLYRDPFLYQNIKDPTNLNQWIGLTLISENPMCNRMALGSKVMLSTQDEKNLRHSYFQEAILVNGFSAQHDSRIIFGVPKGEKILNLEVNWCGKYKQVFNDIKLNQYQTLHFKN